MKKTFIFIILLAFSTVFGKDKIELSEDIQISIEYPQIIAESTPVQSEIYKFDKIDSKEDLDVIIQALIAINENKNITISIGENCKIDCSKYTSVQISAIMAAIAKKAFENVKWYEMKEISDPGTGLWALAMRAKKKASLNENIDQEFKLFIRMLAEINDLDTKTNNLTKIKE